MSDQAVQRIERAQPNAAYSAAAIIRRHSASFALASRVLEPSTRDHAHALYAYCRRADDAIDHAPAGPKQRAALARLRGELTHVYAGRALSDPIAAEFQRLVFERSIPRAYPDALLDGFELDANGATYSSLSDLRRYCWCVAGTVGAMMCHVMGVLDERAVVHGVHLGMGMQLTNICRDVAEDWERGRLYVPTELLGDWQAPTTWPPPPPLLRQLGLAVVWLLKEADGFYSSGDAGLAGLAFRSRLAVAAARHIYSSIGARLLRQGANVAAGRVVVPLPWKLSCVARAAFVALRVKAPLPSRAPQIPRSLVRFPEDVLPV
jgi:phytoene synthase